MAIPQKPVANKGVTGGGESIEALWRRVRAYRHSPLALLMLVMVLVGLQVVPAYGQSWDEYNNYTFGEQALRAYTDGTFLQDQNQAYFHGTFYFMVFSATSRFFADLVPAWELVDGRHFTNYLTFLTAATCLYALALRFMDRRGALGTTALFLTQPLYFGHAFINAKDIPFLAFVLLSVTTGLFAADNFLRNFSCAGMWPAGEPKSRLSADLAAEWAGVGGRSRLAMLVFSLLAVSIVSELFLMRWLYPGLQRAIAQAYAGEINPVLDPLIARFAGGLGAFPLEGYLEKLRIAYLWLRVPTALLVALLPLSYTARLLPVTYTARVQPALQRYGAWVAAGVVLGLTGAIRVIGPFAGVLVSLYALSVLRRRALVPLIIYWTVQAAALYLAWPSLWGDPVGNLWTRLVTAGDFDPNILLFEGRHLLSSELPRSYVPQLMGLQFTELFLGLLLVGILLAVLAVRSGQLDRLPASLLALWFIVPVGTQILLGTTVYDNFRHFLFATPPLFLSAGYGLRRIVVVSGRALVWWLVLLLVGLAGMIPILRLHPYEYIYYNRLAGGVSGADGRYELDYWCTSYRAAMGYLNERAPGTAGVLVLGPDEAARAFARPDLVIETEDASIVFLDTGEAVRELPWEPLALQAGEEGITRMDFVLTCKSAQRGIPHYPDLQIVFAVRRGGVVLSEVKAVVGDKGP